MTTSRINSVSSAPTRPTSIPVGFSASTNDQGQRIIGEGQGAIRISGNVSGQSWPANGAARPTCAARGAI
jgi:hypothetical protein